MVSVQHLVIVLPDSITCAIFDCAFETSGVLYRWFAIGEPCKNDKGMCESCAPDQINKNHIGLLCPMFNLSPGNFTSCSWRGNRHFGEISHGTKWAMASTANCLFTGGKLLNRVIFHEHA